MKHSKTTIKYLKGEEFSNGYILDVSDDEREMKMRIEYLEKTVKNKKVVHLGFADHLPLIKSKIEQNNWLHQRLINSSNLCIGIDIDEDCVNYVSGDLGIPNVYHYDITSDALFSEIINEKWDYLILGEVLEHIDNPVQFLSGINKKYSPYFDKFIITVPNAFDLNNIKLLRKNKECINSDHRYWFTAYTLSKVAILSGFEIDELHFCQSYEPNNFFSIWLLKRYPQLREGILIILNFSR